MNDLREYQLAQTEMKKMQKKLDRVNQIEVYNKEVDKNLKELEKYQTEKNHQRKESQVLNKEVWNQQMELKKLHKRYNL